MDLLLAAHDDYSDEDDDGTVPLREGKRESRKIEGGGSSSSNHCSSWSGGVTPSTGYCREGDASARKYRDARERR